MAQVIEQLNVDSSCSGDCAGCERYFRCTLPQKDELMVQTRMQAARESLKGIKHKIISVGGKGGVGKTLIAANLAAAFGLKGRKVSVLDQVFDGPCIPRMLGVEGQGLGWSPEGFIPIESPLGIQVISMGCILAEDEVVTWFHEMKRSATEELLTQVIYGERDYLIIDVPAGTSSDTVNVIQYIPDIDGATVVTVPSEVSQAVAYKAIVLLREAGVPVFGIFENLAGFKCPTCDEEVDLIQSGGGKRLAEKTGVPFLGSIPIDSMVAECADEGEPIVARYPDSEAARVMKEGAERIERRIWRE